MPEQPLLVVDTPACVLLTLCIQTTMKTYPQLVDELLPLIQMMSFFSEKLGFDEERLGKATAMIADEYKVWTAPAYAERN